MGDYSLYGRANGTRVSGPSNAIYSRDTNTFGVEFTVTKPVWLKACHFWRNNNLFSGTPTFQLYQVRSSTSGTSITGGSGRLPAGNYRGWGVARANPLPLVPGVVYKMAVTAPGYYAETIDTFHPSDLIYPDGLNSGDVLIAPNSSDAVSVGQMTYLGGSGYPSSNYRDTNWWVDVTVTDVNPAAVLVLGARGTKGKYGTATIGLGTQGQSTKRVVKASGSTMHLAAIGFYQFSSSVKGETNIEFGSFVEDLYHHTDEVHGEVVLPMFADGVSSKSVLLHHVAELQLRTVSYREFFRSVANAVRDSLLTNHWSDTDMRFRQAADLDAESLSATAYGGLFLSAIADHDRSHLNIRHLRSFRVKHHDVLATNYEGPRRVMGYKPYSELGEDPHVNPPAVIDQAGSWAAVLFKMRYGEPVGDDVDSLRKWSETRIVRDPDKSLHGAQFLGYSRTVDQSGYTTAARPSLATAAWALLAASDLRGVLGIDAPERPTPTEIVLQSVPEPDRVRFRLAVSWKLEPGDTATHYEAQVEKKTPVGDWVPVLPAATTDRLNRALDGDRYVVRWLIPAPPYSTSFRVRIRVRNADAGEWGTSYSQAIPADRLAIRHFLDEDDLSQGVSGGVAWTESSVWRWLSPGS